MALALGALALAACEPKGRKYITDECIVDSQCDDGVCSDERRCYRACAGQIDCEAVGEVCARKLDVDGTERGMCVPMSDPAVPQGCVTDGDCAALVAGPCEHVGCEDGCVARARDDGELCTVRGDPSGTCEAGRCRCGDACGRLMDEPAATFPMGCDAAVDTLCAADEGPIHAVTVPAFAIDETEVSVDAWLACVAEGACTKPAPGQGCAWLDPKAVHRPVDCVSWAQARVYCRWAGRRLCTEAEWERAARGPEGRPFPWGDAEPTCERAAFDATGDDYPSTGDGCGTGAAYDVGSFPAGATPEGVLDLAGNAWEWVADEYAESFAATPIDGSAYETPAAANGGVDRVARGGGYYNRDASLRATHRHLVNQKVKNWTVALGLRCCR
jgi:formylglycine-generating enzyme required for sulfatase activity